MNTLLKKQIHNWLINNYTQTNNSFDFISIKELANNFFTTIHEQTTTNKTKSFSMFLSHIIKELNWNIEKSKKNNIRGYLYIKKYNPSNFSGQPVQAMNTTSTTCSTINVQQVQPQSTSDTTNPTTIPKQKKSEIPKNSPVTKQIIQLWLNTNIKPNNKVTTKRTDLLENLNKFVLENEYQLDMNNKGGRLTSMIINQAKIQWPTTEIKLYDTAAKVNTASITGLQIKNYENTNN